MGRGRTYLFPRVRKKKERTNAMSEGAQKALREEKEFVLRRSSNRLKADATTQSTGWLDPSIRIEMPAGRHKMQHALSIT